MFNNPRPHSTDLSVQIAYYDREMIAAEANHNWQHAITAANKIAALFAVLGDIQEAAGEDRSANDAGVRPYNALAASYWQHLTGRLAA